MCLETALRKVGNPKLPGANGLKPLGGQQMMELLEDFGNEGLWHLIDNIVCKPCHAKGDSPCNNCLGVSLIAQVERQIAQQGIAFMKGLVREWTASPQKGREGGIC